MIGSGDAKELEETWSFDPVEAIWWCGVAGCHACQCEKIEDPQTSITLSNGSPAQLIFPSKKTVGHKEAKYAVDGVVLDECQVEDVGPIDE